MTSLAALEVHFFEKNFHVFLENPATTLILIIIPQTVDFAYYFLVFFLQYLYIILGLSNSYCALTFFLSKQADIMAGL